MAKESEKITRVDVRIPNNIYEKIEAIAVETNQPVHHRSGKPVVTPIIINLLNLGLEAVKCEDFNLESLKDKLSGDNRINIKSIEERVTANLTEKLSGINRIDSEAIEKKLLGVLEDKLESLLEERLTEMKNIWQLQNEADLTQPQEEIDSLSDILGKELSDKKADTLPEIIEKVDETQSLSLNQTELGRRLGYSSHSTVSKKFKELSREEFIEWSKARDPQGYGWYKLGDKFEVVVYG